MIKQRTVFVLGAGASENYGFPDGARLTQSVYPLSQESGLDDADVECFRELDFSPLAIMKFALALLRSAQYSVDAFLERRPEYIPIGKALIAYFLIRRERTARLFGGEDNWYQYILERMNDSFDDFGENQIAFITFNYDRSLEQFFYTALLNCHGKSPEETATKVNSIPIIHVHGQLGFLEWQNQPEDLVTPTREYDPKITPHTVKIAAKGIQIVHESHPSTREFQLARTALEKAERIFFLGFGYNRVNMQRLNIGQGNTQYMCGSRFGRTDAECVGLLNAHPQLHLGRPHQKTLLFLREEVSSLG